MHTSATGHPLRAASRAAVAALVLLSISAATCWSAGRLRLDASENADKGSAQQRLREGVELIDVLGHFRMAGDRATFYPLEGQASYAGLENLNLERVTLMISDTSDPLIWRISGVVTEYRGSNFVLISKAVLVGQRELSQSGPTRGRTRSTQAGEAP